MLMVVQVELPELQIKLLLILRQVFLVRVIIVCKQQFKEDVQVSHNALLRLVIFDNILDQPLAVLYHYFCSDCKTALA